MVFLVITYIFLSALTRTSNAKNILISHSFYSGSHVLTLHKVSEALISRGHRVTTVRFLDTHNFTLKPLGPLHTDILLGINNSDRTNKFLSPEEEGAFLVPQKVLWEDGLTPSFIFTLPQIPWRMTLDYCKALLSNSTLLDLLLNKKFDIAIVDLLFNECGLALSQYLNITTLTGFWAFSFVGAECDIGPIINPASSIPTLFTGFDESMTLLQRATNLFYKYFVWIPLMKFHYFLSDNFIREYVPKEALTRIPPIANTLSQLNHVFINSDYVIDYPSFRGPNTLNVGGLQISKKVPELPKDLQKFLDGAKNGAILFSMGFIFNSKAIPKESLYAILRAFESLPQRIVFKFDTDIPNLPPNVLIRPFLPQQSIMAHPNLKLFFTHCGMHSVLEAIYYAVPMVGMPVFIDQGEICAKVNHKKLGRILKKESKDLEIHNAIVEVINDTTYRDNIQALSRLFRLKKNHPIDDFVEKVEHLIETDGSPHLIPASQYHSFIKYFNIDVLLLFIFICWLFKKNMFFILRKIRLSYIFKTLYLRFTDDDVKKNS